VFGESERLAYRRMLGTHAADVEFVASAAVEARDL
jgi:hypothetical protein